MHPDISAFVSQQFYEGKLDDFPHAASHSFPRPRFLPDDPKLLVLDTREHKRNTGDESRGDCFALFRWKIQTHLGDLGATQ
jgi:superfamily I DNA and/or RNA helicase